MGGGGGASPLGSFFARFYVLRSHIFFITEKN